MRRGWTIGACAMAAARAAIERLHGGALPDPIAIALPGGQRPAFAPALAERGLGFARAVGRAEGLAVAVFDREGRLLGQAG